MIGVIENGESLANFGFAYLWRQMAIGPKNSCGIGVPQLFGNCKNGGAGLDQLAGVSVTQAMENEAFRESRFKNSGSERVPIRSIKPWAAIVAQKHVFMRLAVLDEIQKPRHGLIWQEDKPRPMGFDRRDINAIAVPAHIPAEHAHQFRGAASRVECP